MTFIDDSPPLQTWGPGNTVVDHESESDRSCGRVVLGTSTGDLYVFLQRGVRLIPREVCLQQLILAVLEQLMPIDFLVLRFLYNKEAWLGVIICLGYFLSKVPCLTTAVGGPLRLILNAWRLIDTLRAMNVTRESDIKLLIHLFSASEKRLYLCRAASGRTNCLRHGVVCGRHEETRSKG